MRLVNYERLDDAIRARKALNGKQPLGPEVGPIRVGFAKDLAQGTPGTPLSLESDTLSLDGASHLMRNQQGNSLQTMLQLASSLPQVDKALVSGSNLPMHQKPEEAFGDEYLQSLQDPETIVKQITSDLGATKEVLEALKGARNETMYHTSVPTAQESVGHPRKWDGARQREIRKKLDGGCSVQDVESIAMDVLDEAAELASDYIGNVCLKHIFGIDFHLTPLRQSFRRSLNVVRLPPARHC